MTDFEKIAHLIRFGLPLKKITKDTIIDWADKKIKDSNDEIFYDLSIAKDSNKIIEFFTDKVAWDFNNIEIRTLILSYYREYLKKKSELWFEIEEELFCYFDLLNYDNSNNATDDFLYYLSDDIALRKEGFGSMVAEMPEYLVDNLSNYSDYNKLTEFLIKNGLVGYKI